MTILIPSAQLLSDYVGKTNTCWILKTASMRRIPHLVDNFNLWLIHTLQSSLASHTLESHRIVLERRSATINLLLSKFLRSIHTMPEMHYKHRLNNTHTQITLEGDKTYTISLPQFESTSINPILASLDFMQFWCINSNAVQPMKWCHTNADSAPELSAYNLDEIVYDYWGRM